MVQAVIDPIRVPTLNLSPAELEEYQALIDEGQLPRDFLDRYLEAVERNVFGHDHKKDRHGNPIEQGIGAPGNMTRNAIEAYVKNQTERSKFGPEPGYEENVKRMEAQLAECEQRRKELREAAAAARRKKARAA